MRQQFLPRVPGPGELGYDGLKDGYRGFMRSPTWGNQGKNPDVLDRGESVSLAKPCGVKWVDAAEL